MKDIKVVQYGCGKMSVYTMRYVLEKGGTIVGAVDINPAIIGQDIGPIIGRDCYGVVVTSVADVEALLKETKPDLCIITTMSLMKDCADALLLCARLGINAITTCEEAFYPWNSSPKLTEEIDRLAKENHCTITGSGYQDAFWGNLITILAGATHRIDRIEGSSSYNVEDYGIALAQAHGAGLTKEEFENQIASLDNIGEETRKQLIAEGNFIPSYMWNVNGWLCDKLGYHVVKQTQKCVPMLAEQVVSSSTLEMSLDAGMVTGMSAVVTTMTEEGVTLETKCIGKVYSEEEFDRNAWEILGEPNTKLVIDRPSTVELTCATVVNRIPDVLAAPDGFIPTSQMGELKPF